MRLSSQNYILHWLYFYTICTFYNHFSFCSFRVIHKQQGFPNFSTARSSGVLVQSANSYPTTLRIPESLVQSWDYVCLAYCELGCRGCVAPIWELLLRTMGYWRERKCPKGQAQGMLTVGIKVVTSLRKWLKINSCLSEHSLVRLILGKLCVFL